MAIEITMPQLSDTMDEGTILTWLKKEGEKVERGDALAEVATDKADLEIESFHQGTLLKVHAKEGETIKVGTLIAVIGNEGEVVADVPQTAAPKKKETIIQAVPTASAPIVEQQPVAAPASTEGERVKISPLARNLAQAHGIDYSSLTGSGEGGRIVKKDIEAVVSAPASTGTSAHNGIVASTPQVTPSPAPAQQAPAVSSHSTVQPSLIPLSKMRQAIASQMVKSKTTIPHFCLTSTLYVDELVSMRQTLKALPQYEGITYNHLMIKACALALTSHPRINASYKDGNLSQPNSVNIGIVTALEDGLLIPVLKNAAEISLADVVAESRVLVQRARTGRPKPDDLVGGTFSISNIGRLDVDNFTAIINPSQSAILAVGALKEEPVVEDGALAIAKVIRVCLSVDHRIIDGLVAGQFLTELKRIIENPVLLLA